MGHCGQYLVGEGLTVSLDFSVANTTRVRSVTFRLCFPRLRRVTSPTPTVCRERCSPFWLLSIWNCSLQQPVKLLPSIIQPVSNSHTLLHKALPVWSKQGGDLPTLSENMPCKRFSLSSKIYLPLHSYIFHYIWTVPVGRSIRCRCFSDSLLLGSDHSLLKLGIRGSEPHDPKNRWSLWRFWRFSQWCSVRQTLVFKALFPNKGIFNMALIP